MATKNILIVQPAFVDSQNLKATDSVGMYNQFGAVFLTQTDVAQIHQRFKKMTQSVGREQPVIKRHSSEE